MLLQHKNVYYIAMIIIIHMIVTYYVFFEQIDEAFIFDLMNMIGTRLVNQNVDQSVSLNQSDCYSVTGPEPEVYNQSRAFIHSFVNVSAFTNQHYLFTYSNIY